jgi:hypothetical protein
VGPLRRPYLVRFVEKDAAHVAYLAGAESRVEHAPLAMMCGPLGDEDALAENIPEQAAYQSRLLKDVGARRDGRNRLQLSGDSDRTLQARVNDRAQRGMSAQHTRKRPQ